MDEVNAKKELPACPVETTLTLIGDKWKVLILRDLMPGTRRFGELKKVRGQCVSEGLDRPTPGDGGKTDLFTVRSTRKCRRERSIR